MPLCIYVSRLEGRNMSTLSWRLGKLKETFSLPKWTAEININIHEKVDGGQQGLWTKTEFVPTWITAYLTVIVTVCVRVASLLLSSLDHMKKSYTLKFRGAFTLYWCSVIGVLISCSLFCRLTDLIERYSQGHFLSLVLSNIAMKCFILVNIDNYW